MTRSARSRAVWAARTAAASTPRERLAASYAYLRSVTARDTGRRGDVDRLVDTVAAHLAATADQIGDLR
ncbi:MAG: hypothetical protein ACRCZP_16375 [Phycicoccus sp.]